MPDKKYEGTPLAPGTKRWATLRLILGNAQMFGAASGLVLLLMTGVSAATLTVLGITCALTIVSLLVFRDPPRLWRRK